MQTARTILAMNNYDLIYMRRSLKESVSKLTIYPSDGATVRESGWVAYALSAWLGVPVDFIHNDTRYKVSLEMTAVEKVIPSHV